MIDYYKDRKYFVYRHIAPNGKMYIGITSKSNPEQRWMTDGSGYSSNRHFWNAIQKYGWNNFKHIIVAHGLSVDTACHLEAYLIDKYDSMSNGYNQTSGGIYPTEVTDEIRIIISNKIKAYHNSLPEGAWSAKFVGHAVSPETKKKIASKALGRQFPQEVIDRRAATFRANMTDERRKLRSDISKNRKVSQETREKLSKINKGKQVSEYTKSLLREKAIHRYTENDYIWVHKSSSEMLINSCDMYDYLDQGYELGRSNVKNKYIHKGAEIRKVSESELAAYLADGWILGHTDLRRTNISNSKKKYIYMYSDLSFYSGEELANYLRNNGYPKISQGTVNEICRGKKFLAYPDLDNTIIRRVLNENI